MAFNIELNLKQRRRRFSLHKTLHIECNAMQLQSTCRSLTVNRWNEAMPIRYMYIQSGCFHCTFTWIAFYPCALYGKSATQQWNTYSAARWKYEWARAIGKNGAVKCGKLVDKKVFRKSTLCTAHTQNVFVTLLQLACILLAIGAQFQISVCH